jgi:hypothetical protein
MLDKTNAILSMLMEAAKTLGGIAVSPANGSLLWTSFCPNPKKVETIFVSYCTEDPTILARDSIHEIGVNMYTSCFFVVI